MEISDENLKLEEKKGDYWLLKTEPAEWSWDDQTANGGVANWDGVKNKQSQKYMKSMKLGDLCFFYHSGAKSRRVVEVVREWYDEGEAVDVKAVGEMRAAVGLAEMKKELKGVEFALFRQPRLSVLPVEKGVRCLIICLTEDFAILYGLFKDIPKSRGRTCLLRLRTHHYRHRRGLGRCGPRVEFAHHPPFPNCQPNLTPPSSKSRHSQLIVTYSSLHTPSCLSADPSLSLTLSRRHLHYNAVSGVVALPSREELRHHRLRLASPATGSFFPSQSLSPSSPRESSCRRRP
ncbi:thymocyte nuclear protein 1-like [Salvia divinorum]|uniref:Thymocyte nuclear protein 1-like n=1 Tax=Salvia divinorum TaxID=28513 RepID=A0ABD1FWE1_SALDI